MSRMVLAAATLLSARVALADPASTRCYAGVETATVGKLTRTFRTVSQRTLDPDASAIRQRSWTEKAPDQEIDVTFRVTVKDGTFEFDHPQLGAHGSGKLEGKPWQWTGYTFAAKTDKVDMAGRGTITADTVALRIELRRGGKVIGAIVGDSTAFDCPKLDERRAALAKPAK